MVVSSSEDAEALTIQFIDLSFMANVTNKVEGIALFILARSDTDIPDIPDINIDIKRILLDLQRITEFKHDWNN